MSGTSVDRTVREGVMLDVAVIGGGRSAEHEVSLASAAAVAAGLDRDRYRVHEFTIDPDGGWRHPIIGSIDAAVAMAGIAACDVAIPMLHGPNGEDGTLAGLLELIGVPYVGSGVRAGALAMDKWATKLVAQAVGIPVAPGRLLTATNRAAGDWNGPVVVKPASCGSSRGVTLVRDPAQLASAIDHALEFDDRVLLEQFVVGREVDLAVLCGPGGASTPAPALEITRADIFGFDEKYGGGAQFTVPAAIPDEDLWMLRAHATRIAEALGCRGIIRADFFLTEDGPVLGEVNTTPGFTAQSQVPRMFAAAGVDYAALLDLLISSALPDPALPDPAPFATLGDKRPTLEVRA